MKKLYKFSDFLINRKDRYDPKSAGKLGLKRIDKIDFAGNIYLSEKISNTGMILIKNGDLVISGINVEKGAVAVYQGLEDVLATIHYSSYQFDPSIIDIDYMKLYVKSQQFKMLIRSASNGGIKTEIKPKHLLPLEILLPEVNEQKEIVMKVNKYLKKIKEFDESQSSQIVDLKKIRQLIFQDAIRGELVSQDLDDEPITELLAKIKVEKDNLIRVGKLRKEKTLSPILANKVPFELPSGWEWSKLENIIIDKPKNGYSPKSVDYETKTKSLKLSSTTSGFFKKTEYKYVDEIINDESYLWLSPGDILIQRSNSLEYVGISAVFDDSKEKYIYPDLMMKIRVIKPLLIEYIHIALLAPQTRSYFRSHASGTAGSMPKINQVTVSNTLIPLPPINEQKRIVDKVAFLMEICNEQEKNISVAKENIKKLNQAILREMFE